MIACLCTGALPAKAKHRTHKSKSPAAAEPSVVRSGKVSRRHAAKTAQTSRNRQLSPTPDRYREIQEALASKGYLKSAPNGVWDQESTGALRRFQGERNLEATGRVNSLSLIALGLGPKTAATEPVPEPTPAQPQAEH